MKICKNCGTQNSDNFIFCRNCGAMLDSQTGNTQNGYGSVNQNNFGGYNAPYGAPQAADCVSDFDGVSVEEMRAYIGTANNQKILNTLAKMQLTGSKTSWCFPASLLTLFFGFGGGAMWLLYRKVYKQGFLFAVLGVIETLLSLYVTFLQSAAVINLNGISLLGLASLGINAIRIVGFVIIGLFAYKWYKDTAVERIKVFREYNTNHPYYLYGVSQEGGTSGGMLAIAVIILIIPSVLYIIFNGMGDILL